MIIHTPPSNLATGAPSPAPSECLLALITGSKKQFVPSSNSRRCLPHFQSVRVRAPTHSDETREGGKNAHKHLAHYAKTPAAGNTSPTGCERVRSEGTGGGRGVGGAAGRSEKPKDRTEAEWVISCFLQDSENGAVMFSFIQLYTLLQMYFLLSQNGFLVCSSKTVLVF